MAERDQVWRAGRRWGSREVLEADSHFECVRQCVSITNKNSGNTTTFLHFFFLFFFFITIVIIFNLCLFNQEQQNNFLADAFLIEEGSGTLNRITAN